MARQARVEFPVVLITICTAVICAHHYFFREDDRRFIGQLEMQTGLEVRPRKRGPLPAARTTVLTEDLLA